MCEPFIPKLQRKRIANPQQGWAAARKSIKKGHPPSQAVCVKVEVAVPASVH
jgi:hypothetical protein